jgi:hypothetical protein
VLRKLSLLAVLAGAMVPWTASHGQEQQPSLGDVARQARKDKEKNTTPKTVITDESLPSSKTVGGLGLPDLGDAKPAATAGSTDPVAEGWAGLERAQAALNKLEPMDRATLAKAALQGNNVDFPNRRNWEERLFSAKQVYVSHSRELVGEMKQLLEAGQSLHSQGSVASDDPRVEQLTSVGQRVLQDATQTEASFKAIILEGQDLAKQAKPR